MWIVGFTGFIAIFIWISDIVNILCNSFIKSQGKDPQFLIWDALAFGAEGKTSQGLATLEKLKWMMI